MSAWKPLPYFLVGAKYDLPLLIHRIAHNSCMIRSEPKTETSRRNGRPMIMMLAWAPHMHANQRAELNDPLRAMTRRMLDRAPHMHANLGVTPPPAPASQTVIFFDDTFVMPSQALQKYASPAWKTLYQCCLAP